METYLPQESRSKRRFLCQKKTLLLVLLADYPSKTQHVCGFLRRKQSRTELHRTATEEEILNAKDDDDDSGKGT